MIEETGKSRKLKKAQIGLDRPKPMTDLDDLDHYTAHVAELQAEIDRLKASILTEIAKGTYALAAEIVRLQTDNERLRALVKELADDLEAEVEGHYRDTKDYPSELRRYERDIDSVRRARAALEPKP